MELEGKRNEMHGSKLEIKQKIHGTGGGGRVLAAKMRKSDNKERHNEDELHSGGDVRLKEEERHDE